MYNGGIFKSNVISFGHKMCRFDGFRDQFHEEKERNLFIHTIFMVAPTNLFFFGFLRINNC